MIMKPQSKWIYFVDVLFDVIKYFVFVIVILVLAAMLTLAVMTHIHWTP